MKTLREYIDQLDEISRRGFLKGMGAAALGGMGMTAANTAKAEIRPAPPSQPGDAPIDKLIIIYRPENLNSFYPKFSKDIREQGSPEIRMHINENGIVVSVEITKSSGYARLDKAAMQIGSLIRFKPHLINGIASPVNTSISIKFQLSGEQKPLSYGDRVKQKIGKPIFDLSKLEGNPTTYITVKLAPDGRILDTAIQPSGNEAWDAAVLAQVNKSQFFPKDENGNVPRLVRLKFNPLPDETSLEEASLDAVKRIEQLVRYK